MIDVAPGEVLAASGIVKFVAEIAVFTVEKEVYGYRQRGDHVDRASQRRKPRISLRCLRIHRTWNDFVLRHWRGAFSLPMRRRSCSFSSHAKSRSLASLGMTTRNEDFFCNLLGLGGGSSSDQRSGLDVIEFRPAFFQVGIALLFELILVRPRVVAIAFVHHFDDVHAIAIDHAERCEAHAIEAAVVLEVDKYLRGTGIGTGGREDQCAALVGLRYRIVLNIGVFPGGGDGGIRADTELHHESRHHAEKCGVIVIMVLNQVVETVSAKRSPGAGDG